MKNLFFEIKNYLIVLSLFIFLFLALIFFPPIPDGALGSDYEQKEVTREKVLFTDNKDETEPKDEINNARKKRRRSSASIE